MADQMQYPFQLIDVFFISFHCQRQPIIADPISIAVKISLKVVYDNFPELEVFLKVENYETQTQSITFDAEVVGKFAPAPDQPKPDKNIIPDFIDDRALFILWPVISQQFKQMTGLMGMNPIKLLMPARFDSHLQIAATGEQTKEGEQA